VIVVPATPPLKLPDTAGAVQAARVPAARAPSDSRLARAALPDVYPLYVDLAHKLQTWAQDHGRSLAQLAVAWTLSKPGAKSASVGAKSPEQVSAIAGADDWKLTQDEAAEVDSIVTTLPGVAKQARMVVWDHFPAEVLGAMAQRRRDDLEAGS